VSAPESPPLAPASAPTRVLRVLIVEDFEPDAGLLVRELERHGYTLAWRRVAGAAQLEESLARESWDLVLSDYVLPGFGGLEALEIVKASGLDLPFILVSGTVGEDVAVGAMRAGAHDYLLKDRLTRLGAAVARELREAEDRRARRRAEEAARASQAETRRLLEAAEGSRHALLSVIEDQKHTAAELRLQTTALEAAANAIIITDPEGRIDWVNPAFTVLTGYTREESRGRNPRELVLSGKHDQAHYANLWDTILAGRVWHGELINRRKDGSLYAEEQTITPVRGDDGRIIHFIAVKQDITERRRAEEERQALDAQLRQAQKMESVGRLAGGVAHDFNNALGVVLGRAELALRRLEPGNPAGRHLEAIREAALRSANLTRQLLAFARRQTITPRVLDLNEAVAGMLDMLRHLIGESVCLSWTPGDGLRPVKVDPAQIDQVLANLLVNARDAIGGVGQVRVETRNVTLDETFCAGRAGSAPGEYVVLSVADDGCGMEKEVLDRMFEPFFTTKPVGQGTGLGLATVYGIVKQNSGYIDVASEPGKGTTFDLYLPSVTGQAPEEAPASGAAVEPRGRGEIVLLVEDEPAMLDVEAEMLTDLGYAVLKAGRPGQALSVAGAHAGAIHLLITDMVMPEMNGRDLAERLAAVRPGIRCLFLSGYTADVIARRGVLDEDVRLLEKPFSRKDLAVKVRQTLED
jgi:PAS domain S-box-containing protein